MPSTPLRCSSRARAKRIGTELPARARSERTRVLQAANGRADGLQRENQSLRGQISMLTEQLNAAPLAGEGTEATLDGDGRRATSPVATPAYLSGVTRLCLSGSSGRSTGTPAGEFSGMLGGGGRGGLAPEDGAGLGPSLRRSDSMDGRSNKSDNLTGDEMDMLGQGAGMRLVSASSVSGSGRDISPMKSPPFKQGRDATTSQKLHRCAALVAVLTMPVPSAAVSSCPSAHAGVCSWC